jgi:hypothetical protein
MDDIGRRQFKGQPEPIGKRFDHGMNVESYQSIKENGGLL